MATELIESLPKSNYILTDYSYDADYFRWTIEEINSLPLISKKIILIK